MGKFRVLVVDDYEGARYLLKEFLEREGCVVSEAADGLKAQEALNRDQGSYDLVVTDFEMPRLNSIELTRWAKNTYPRTKIVLVTGRSEEEVHEEARAAGADEVLRKPFDPYKSLRPVIEKIKNLEPAPR